MKNTDLKKFNLPDSPGVYFFLGGKSSKKILYIGKATSLKDRVKSYFAKDILLTRGPKIEKMLEEAKMVEFKKTDSVLEAMLLEAHEIKRLQPPYNTKAKDNKSYNFVTITKEDFPQVVVTRGSGTFGPFPHGKELKEALRIIRKLFPYRDRCKPGAGKRCFNAQIGLCPGVCSGEISKGDYRKIIGHIKLMFEGKKERVLRSLEKEMQALAKAHKFEEADKVKKQIFALDHIQDIALIKADLSHLRHGGDGRFRIEAYDIAHLAGKDVVGVMTVVVDGELDKSQYRKFKIRVDKNDDTQNLKEVLSRRLAHPEWRYPNLIVVDGGKGQINVAKKVLKDSGLDEIEVVSVLKDERHKPKEVLGSKQFVVGREKEILLANAEAHRFAIGYHRKLRGKGFRI